MLDGKLAVVTGAARGLGYAVSRELAGAGARVLMVGRDADALNAACERLRDPAHAVIPHVADVTDVSAVAALGARVLREFGGADILINNAGVFLEPKNFANPVGAGILEVDPDLVAATLDANTIAPLRLIQALVPGMVDKGWGRVVNVSSGMGKLADMGGHWPGYRSSKTALNALTRILAAELAGSGVLVNAVCPGWCRTTMGGEQAERSAEEGASSIAWAALLPDDGPSGGFFRDGQSLPW